MPAELRCNRPLGLQPLRRPDLRWRGIWEQPAPAQPCLLVISCVLAFLHTWGGSSAQEGANTSGADTGHAGRGAPCLGYSQSQPNTALVKPMSLGTGMSLSWVRPAGHCFFESLHSQLSAPLFWVSSPFHGTLSDKDCGPLIPSSMSFQSAWSFVCLPWTSHCLFLKIPAPVQVRQQQHPAARGLLRGWSLAQHPNVPQQHVAGGVVPVRASCC